ncbi:MAG: AEC family transporter [Elusimicrobiota bacterium]|nr:AEC family transporter [Elusimicrobiota bacterium]
MDLLFNLLAKIIPYIFIGWIFTKLKFKNAELPINYFVNFALYFLIPIFIFFAMWSAPLSENIVNAKSVIFTVLIVCFFGVLFALVHSKIFKSNFRDVALPIIFMNSAYLAIPLNTVFFGKDGTFYAIIYNIVLTVLHFTFGLRIVSGSIKEIFRLPVLYFAFFGIFLNLTGIKLSDGLSHFSKILSSVTLPVMLCLVGYQIHSVSVSALKKVFAGVFFRMFGGLIVAYIFCAAFNITGTVKGVCLLTSSMPSAVNTYILNKKYDADYSFASSMIAVGLAMTLIVIPLVLWLK